ncbi:hypothetical protein OIO90_003628 [Microbotryomycetes sp. JL221]|nr:hypothetical protein OIO90_003628 [Microbotryomycetes sp. JL221]
MARAHEDTLRELEQARSRIDDLEAKLARLSMAESTLSSSVDACIGSSNGVSGQQKRPMSLREYQRYGRQMILSNVGLQGQLKLKNARVLVVGAGGLGCPVLQYLVSAGVGNVTIVDHDTVELSNLHRQVLHNEHRIGMSKAESAQMSLNSLNSDVQVEAHVLPFTPSLFHSSECPESIKLGAFDLVLDCTDNPATRHFINAYTSAHLIPLVSGGAVRTEGTVGVFGLPLVDNEGHMTDIGPCYACIFPSSSNSALDEQEDPSLSQQEQELRQDLRLERMTLQGTGACSDEGVMGITCGVVGVQMAAEAVRVLLGTAKPTLHLLSPLSSSPLRTIKVRARKPDCPTCGQLQTTPSSRWKVFQESETGIWPSWQDPLCEMPTVGNQGVRDSDQRVMGDTLRSNERTGLIVDVRPAAEYGICRLPNSINIPFAKLIKQPSLVDDELVKSASSSDTNPTPVTFVCRRGNDSLLAARAYKRYLSPRSQSQVDVKDLRGGLFVEAHLIFMPSTRQSNNRWKPKDDERLLSTDESDTDNDDELSESSQSSRDRGSKDDEKLDSKQDSGDSDYSDEQGHTRRSKSKKRKRDKLALAIGLGVLLLLIAVVVVGVLLFNSRTESDDLLQSSGDSVDLDKGVQVGLQTNVDVSSTSSQSDAATDGRPDRSPQQNGPNVTSSKESKTSSSPVEPTNKTSEPSKEDKPGDDKPDNDKPDNDKPKDDKPKEERPKADKPSTVDKPKPQDKSNPSLIGGKKGVGYNDADYTKQLKLSWGYNWDKSPQNLAEGVEFVPMLRLKSWDENASGWQENVRKSIAKGATAILGFNEPDLAEQAHMTIEQAVKVWREEIEPIGKEFPDVKLISPAVTNGGAPMGVRWLKSFVDACAGCRIDGVALHWYDSASNTAYFFKHFEEAYKELQKPLWITEFMGLGSPDEQADFLRTVVPWLEQQQFVERYAAFACFSDNPIANFIDKDGKANALGKLYSEL